MVIPSSTTAAIIEPYIFFPTVAELEVEVRDRSPTSGMTALIQSSSFGPNFDVQQIMALEVLEDIYVSLEEDIQTLSSSDPTDEETMA